MNRIVRENYPVSKLPEELREGFEADAEVRITIDATQSDKSHEPNPFSRFKHVRRANFASAEEVDAYVRSLRDEWSDRER